MNVIAIGKVTIELPAFLHVDSEVQHTKHSFKGCPDIYDIHDDRRLELTFGDGDFWLSLKED